MLILVEKKILQLEWVPESCVQERMTQLVQFSEPQKWWPEHRAAGAYRTPGRKNHPAQRESLLCTWKLGGRVRMRTLCKNEYTVLGHLDAKSSKELST